MKITKMNSKEFLTVQILFNWKLDWELNSKFE